MIDLEVVKRRAVQNALINECAAHLQKAETALSQAKVNDCNQFERYVGIAKQQIAGAEEMFAQLHVEKGRQLDEFKL